MDLPLVGGVLAPGYLCETTGESLGSELIAFSDNLLSTQESAFTRVVPGWTLCHLRPSFEIHPCVVLGHLPRSGRRQWNRTDMLSGCKSDRGRPVRPAQYLTRVAWAERCTHLPTVRPTEGAVLLLRAATLVPNHDEVPKTPFPEAHAGSGSSGTAFEYCVKISTAFGERCDRFGVGPVLRFSHLLMTGALGTRPTRSTSVRVLVSVLAQHRVPLGSSRNPQVCLISAFSTPALLSVFKRFQVTVMYRIVSLGFVESLCGDRQPLGDVWYSWVWAPRRGPNHLE